MKPVTYTEQEYQIITQCLKESPLNKNQAFKQAVKIINQTLGKQRTLAGVACHCYSSEHWRKYQKEHPAFNLTESNPNTKNIPYTAHLCVNLCNRILNSLI